VSRPITIGGKAFGDGPRAAVVIDRPLPPETVAGLARRGADLLEIRVDLFADGPGAAIEYVKQLRAAAPLPLLATIRETDRTRQRRLDLFEQVIPYVDAIDIEVDAAIRDRVVSCASGKVVIVSDHDFAGMPDADRCRSIVDQTRACNGHVAKIAGTARDGADTARLLAFCLSTDFPLIAIAMGPHGAVSRVLGPLFGSLVSYTFVGDAVAPGQIGLDELAGEFSRYYPGYTVPAAP